MGDIGSILLGSAFAGLIWLAAESLLDFVCMVLFLFPFYVDELTTVLVRLKDMESLTKPHRRHYYQLLANEKGDCALEGVDGVWGVSTGCWNQCIDGAGVWTGCCLGRTGRMVVGVCGGKLQTEETNGKEMGCGMREIVMGGLGFG